MIRFHKTRILAEASSSVKALYLHAAIPAEVQLASFGVTFSTCQEAKSPTIISELSEASSSGYMSLFGKQFSEERSVRNILDPFTHGSSPTGWVSIFYVWRSEEGAVFLLSHTNLKLDRTLSDSLRGCLVSTKMELFIDTCCLCGKLLSGNLDYKLRRILS